MKPIKAAIYDVDGTLVNSEPLHVAAWDATLKKYGHSLASLSEQFVKTMAGKKPLAIAAEMTAQLQIKVSPAAFLAQKTELFLRLTDQKLEPTHGAVASVERLKAAGYRLAIGTSLDRPLLNKMLHKLGIEGDFEVVVTGDQISKGKPDPETYLAVIEQLGVAPNQCVVFEDAQSGIRAAKAAGAWCIAVGNPEAIQQDTSEADVTVDSLQDVTPGLLDSLASRIDGIPS